MPIARSRRASSTSTARRQERAGNPFKPYDVKGPKPADLATTTTLDGKTVPYIVRREMGTINRAVYAIAFLHEPGTPLPDPWNPGGSSWNGRLIYSFGAGCQAGYHQGRAVGGLLANRSFLEESAARRLRHCERVCRRLVIIECVRHQLRRRDLGRDDDDGQGAFHRGSSACRATRSAAADPAARCSSISSRTTIPACSTA